MTFLGIDHIGIAVHDLETATLTYRDILGFAPTDEEILEERGLHVRFFATGNSSIELLGATRPNSEISKFLEKRGEGLHHICIKVKDLEAEVARIQREGGEILRGIETGAHGSRVAFVHPRSAHGVLLELVTTEPAPSPK